MGCDIHLYVEKKVNNEWKTVKGPNPYYGRFDWEKHKMKFGNWIYSGRDYDFFAFLADVRNDGGIMPLSAPKELPEDVSSYIKNTSEAWGIDGHSHSYFTLKELKKAEMKQKYIKDPLENVIKILSEVQLSEPDEDIRIVFWFDN
jgi:hypothetical protein